MIYVAWSTLIFPAVLLAPSPAAQDTAPADWEANCSFPAGPSRIVFHSLSGDVHEDDMQIRIVWRDQNATVASVRQAWFKPSGFTSNVSSECTGIGAFELPGARLLLWVRYDGRPGFDHLAVLLIDPAHQAVLDVLEDVGEIPGADDHPMVLARVDHFEVLLIKEWLLDRVRGGEFGRPEWKSLTIAGAKVRAQWRN